MSDQTNLGGAGDFRGSAADKRKDETVMVNADDLSNLVSSARQEPEPQVPPAQPVQAPYAPPAALPAKSGPPVALIAGILGVVAVIAVIALLVVLAGR